MKLCANATYGPIPRNAEYQVWKIVHMPSGQDLGESRKIFYADDENGEIWEFAVEDEVKRDGVTVVKRTTGGEPVIIKTVLGPGKLQLKRK